MGDITSPKVIKEAFAVGILLVVFGLVTSFIIGILLGYSKSNRFMGMIMSLFFTGFAVHLVLEHMGINKRYCDRDLGWIQSNSWTS